MAWWVWLILAWVVVAVVGAVWLGLALRTSEARDWVRRGRPERRSGRRAGGYDDWVRRGRPERRSASSEQDRARVALRAGAGHIVPDRRRPAAG